MSKVYCCQCRHYYGNGPVRDRHGKLKETMQRCWRGKGWLHDYVRNGHYKAFDDCDTSETNRWGNCSVWEPKLIIRLLMWRPKWISKS